MLWRLQPTEENRQAIPQPFTPTAVQTANRTASPAIDLLPSPEMRDSLILNHGAYSAQSLVEDFMDCLVVDVTSLGACYRVTEAQTVLLNALSELPCIGLGRQESMLDAILQTPNPQHRLTMQTAHDAGLSRVEEFKVLPTFVAKYPFLEASSSK